MCIVEGDHGCLVLKDGVVVRPSLSGTGFPLVVTTKTGSIDKTANHLSKLSNNYNVKVSFFFAFPFLENKVFSFCFSYYFFWVATQNVFVCVFKKKMCMSKTLKPTVGGSQTVTRGSKAGGVVDFLSKCGAAVWEAAKEALTASQQAEIEEKRRVVVEQPTAQSARKQLEQEVAPFSNSILKGCIAPRENSRKKGSIARSDSAQPFSRAYAPMLQTLRSGLKKRL